MTPVRHRWPLVIAILSFALVARGGAAWWWESRLPAGQRFVFGDSESYWELARCIARGEPYQFGEQAKIFRTPGYPLALAPLFLIWRDSEPPVMAARWLNALWGVLAVAATMGLARVLADEPSALVAGVLAALDPEAIASSVFVLSEAAFMAPMLLQLIAWAAAWRRIERDGPCRFTYAWGFAGGIAAGVATLMRPGWLLFTPWSLVVVLAWQARRGRAALRHAGLGCAMLVGLALAMAPWWYRNYQVSGEFVLTTRQVGASLYDGLNPAAQGGSDMRFAPVFFDQLRREDEETGADPATFEARLDRRIHAAAIEWAKAHPERVAELAAVKLARLWNLWPNASELGGRLTRWAVAATFLPLVGCALWGTARLRQTVTGLAVCWLPIGYLTSLHLVFVSSIRYRQPAIFTLTVLAALAIVDWHRRRVA